MTSQIRFNYADRSVSISPKSFLKKIVEMVFTKEKKNFSQINFIFCSDEFLLQINKDFLQHDYYTDIITFPLSTKGQPVEAEIYISLDRVKQNAKDLQQPFELELVRVMTHGALHLCGYKDKSKSQIKIMREREVYYIDLYKKFHVKPFRLK